MNPILSLVIKGAIETTHINIESHTRFLMFGIFISG